MGGKVMLLALRHPELIAGLIIEDISPAQSSTSEFEHLLGTLRNLTYRRSPHAAMHAKLKTETTPLCAALLQNLIRDEHHGLPGSPICRCSTIISNDC